jgi:hypothetical protein
MDSYEMLTGEQVRPQAAEEKAWYDRMKFW